MLINRNQERRTGIINQLSHKVAGFAIAVAVLTGAVTMRADQILYERGGDYSLILRDNQPTLLQSAQTLLPEDTPP